QAGCGGGMVDSAVRELRFVQVDDDEQRLGREELVAAEPLPVLAFEVQRAERPPLFERGLAEDEHIALALELGSAAFLQVLLEPLEAPLHDAEVREDQL